MLGRSTTLLLIVGCLPSSNIELPEAGESYALASFSEDGDTLVLTENVDDLALGISAEGEILLFSSPAALNFLGLEPYRGEMPAAGPPLDRFPSAFQLRDQNWEVGDPLELGQRVRLPERPSPVCGRATGCIVRHTSGRSECAPECSEIAAPEWPTMPSRPEPEAFESYCPWPKDGDDCPPFVCPAPFQTWCAQCPALTDPRAPDQFTQAWVQPGATIELSAGRRDGLVRLDQPGVTLRGTCGDADPTRIAGNIVITAPDVTVHGVWADRIIIQSTGAQLRDVYVTGDVLANGAAVQIAPGAEVEVSGLLIRADTVGIRNDGAAHLVFTDVVTSTVGVVSTQTSTLSGSDINIESVGPGMSFLGAQADLQGVRLVGGMTGIRTVGANLNATSVRIEDTQLAGILCGAQSVCVIEELSYDGLGPGLHADRAAAALHRGEIRSTAQPLSRAVVGKLASVDLSSVWATADQALFFEQTFEATVRNTVALGHTNAVVVRSSTVVTFETVELEGTVDFAFGGRVDLRDATVRGPPELPIGPLDINTNESVTVNRLLLNDGGFIRCRSNSLVLNDVLVSQTLSGLRVKDCAGGGDRIAIEGDSLATGLTLEFSEMSLINVSVLGVDAAINGLGSIDLERFMLRTGRLGIAASLPRFPIALRDGRIESGTGLELLQEHVEDSLFVERTMFETMRLAVIVEE